MKLHYLYRDYKVKVSMTLEDEFPWNVINLSDLYHWIRRTPSLLMRSKYPQILVVQFDFIIMSILEYPIMSPCNEPNDINIFEIIC